ncbi:MAG: Bax inhibitor-1/YccA family protein [Granulosicoccaceae bacterium]
MQVHSVSTGRVLETNKLIRNTYTLLSMTLVWSAVMAAVSMAISPPFIASLGCSIGAMLIMWFVVPRTANSAKGIYAVFAFTGLLGFGLGPLLNHYLAMANGGQTVMLAMGGTGAIFLGLSGYALSTRKDFSFMGGFIGVGMMVLLLAIVANIFFQVPAVSLAISAAFVLLMSGFILYETSAMVHGHQDNYILACTSLYLSIYNIFTSLLHLLGFASDE